jgi:hypothetical protein
MSASALPAVHGPRRAGSDDHGSFNCPQLHQRGVAVGVSLNTARIREPQPFGVGGAKYTSGNANRSALPAYRKKFASAPRRR